MSEAVAAPWRESLIDARWRVAVFSLFCVGVGVVAGILWAIFAFRPGYRVTDDLAASLGERELANIFAADALFTLLAALCGLIIGVSCWMLFRRHGWWVSVLAVLGAGLAGLVAWQVGLLVTPEDFDERLARAVGGDVVPVDLQLDALAALLVAPFAAIIPVMLLAAFAPEPQETVPPPEPDPPPTPAS